MMDVASSDLVLIITIVIATIPQGSPDGVPVLLISGGIDSRALGGPVVPPGENGPTTEIFDPDTKTIKKMSSLPPPGRYGHSLDSNLACGGSGSETRRTCDVWNGREWKR